MTLFWRNGFSSTSVRDLGTALDLRPGSIYALFQSKENLYIEALKMYAQDHFKLIGQCFQPPLTFMESLERLIREVTSNLNNPRVCMIGKTLADFGAADQTVRAEAARLFQDNLKLFGKKIEQARSREELPPTCDSQFLAHFIIVQLTGLRRYSDSLQDPELLERLIKETMRSIQHCAAAKVE